MKKNPLIYLSIGALFYCIVLLTFWIRINANLKRLRRINESTSAAMTEGKTKSKKDRFDHLEELLKQLNANLERLRRINESTSAAMTEGKTKSKKDRFDRLEELLKQLNANLERLRRINESTSAAERKNENRYSRGDVEVKDPAEFKKAEGTAIFSGPQPGEKLPPLKATGINGEAKGKTSDFIAKANGQPLVLFLQDESSVGLRVLPSISRLLVRIADESKQKMHIGVVFLGDTPDTLAKQASKIVPHVPSDVLLGISPDGREGPGSYGLNRNVAQTVIIAKDGKVIHNFAFTQPMLYPDPYVLGAIGEAIGVKPATLEKWLNEAPAEGERMRRGDDSDEARALGKRLREMVEKGEITGEEARKRYEKAFPSNREDVDQN